MHKLKRQFTYGHHTYEQATSGDDFIVTVIDNMAKPCEPDFSKLATTFTQLKLSGTSDYETWKTKVNAILCLNNVVLEEKTGKYASKLIESQVYHLIVLSAVEKVTIFITSVTATTALSGSLLLCQLEKKYGTSTDANQMAIAAKLHALEYQGGDMKTYLFNFEMFTRKLTGKHQIPYPTLLHLIKNNLIGEYHSICCERC